MIDSFLKTTIFLIIILFAYILKRLNFFKEQDREFVTKIVVYITMPCAIASNFTTEKVETKLYFLFFIGAGVDLLLILAGYLASIKNKSQRSFNVINYTGFNYGSFSLPYISSMLSPYSVTCACLFDAGNSLFCTGGSYALAGYLTDKKEPNRIKKFFTRIFTSPALDLYIILIFISIIGLKLPNYILEITKTVGSANGFLAMVMIGLSLNINKKLMSKKNIKITLKLLGIRYTIILILITILSLMSIAREIKLAIIMILLSPICSLNLIYTKKMNEDYELSAQITSISIIISVIALIIVSPLLTV